MTIKEYRKEQKLDKTDYLGYMTKCKACGGFDSFYFSTREQTPYHEFSSYMFEKAQDPNYVACNNCECMTFQDVIWFSERREGD